MTCDIVRGNLPLKCVEEKDAEHAPLKIHILTDKMGFAGLKHVEQLSALTDLRQGAISQNLSLFIYHIRFQTPDRLCCIFHQWEWLCPWFDFSG